MPPHQGHLLVCDVAQKYVDHMTVLLCSHDGQPIDGFLRAEWMRACLDQKAFSVIHMHRDIPQEPEDHPDFWQIWKDTIFEHHPEPIDVVFGSETYVHKLAQVLGASPHVVDLERQIVPVSGTGIRDTPSKNWNFIPLPVRPYFQKRVTLIGAESTGKSTLSNLLADQFGTKVIPEYGRTYDETFKHGSNWDHDDFVKIADGHFSSATAIAPTAGPIIFEDTDLLQTLVWSQALLGEASQVLIERLKNMKAPDLYLLLNPEMKWVDDGTRYHSDQEQRLRFHAHLKEWLNMKKAPWIEISGSTWDDRQKHAELAIAKLVASAS